jgi:hypothetical protein
MMTLLFGPKLLTPETFSPVNVPTLVTLGCAAVVKLPASDVADIFPAVMFPVTLAYPAMLAPALVTTNTLAVPPDVILTLLLCLLLLQRFR